jgi:hypothetical protein
VSDPAPSLWRRASPYLRRAIPYLRLALFLAGVYFIGDLIRRVGPSNVLAALLGAGPFLPFLIVLEASWLGMDIFVLRALLGDRARGVPWSVWIRSQLTAYPVTVLFPAGRATAEVMRGAFLAPHLGAPAAGLGAILVQGAGLVSTSLIGLVALAVLVPSLGVRHELVAGVALSALVTGALGPVFLFGARTQRSRALLRRFTKLGDLDAVSVDPTSRPLRAVALSFVGRSIQALVYTFALLATSGALSLRNGVIAHSIAVAGATVGDLVPQQAGIIEGGFKLFAGTFGLQDHPDQAVATALLVRACQMVLAALMLLAGLAWRRSAAPATGEVAARD